MYIKYYPFVLLIFKKNLRAVMFGLMSIVSFCKLSIWLGGALWNLVISLLSVKNYKGTHRLVFGGIKNKNQQINNNNFTSC